MTSQYYKDHPVRCWLWCRVIDLCFAVDALTRLVTLGFAGTEFGSALVKWRCDVHAESGAAD